MARGLEIEWAEYGNLSEPGSSLPGEDIHFRDVKVSWGTAAPILSELNFTVKSGELIAVIGRVGCGKSSLLSAILGEMRKLDGTIDVRKVSDVIVTR